MRRLIALVMAALGAGAVFLIVPAASAGPVFPSRLDAGHRWSLKYGEAESPSGRYLLSFFTDGGMELSEDVRRPGSDALEEFHLWSGVLQDINRDCSKGYLAMQTNGNLVLYCRPGHPIWSTRTGGTGTHNYFSVQDNGNLVVRTGGGHRVWASGSTDPFIATGEHLNPGQRIRTQEWDHPFVSLTMRRSGDLVLTYGKRIAWHSNTHVPGSKLVLRRSGNLVVVGPHGNVQWSSHTAGFGVRAELVVYDDGRIAEARLTGRSLQQQWSRMG